MNISPIFSINTSSKIYNTPKNRVVLPQLKNDCVSFSSNKENQTNVMKNSEEFGLKIYELLQNNKASNGNMKKLAREYIPIAEVTSIKNLDKKLGSLMDISQYIAYMLPEYGENCKLKKVTMYAPENRSKIETAGSMAHEFCHCYQRYLDDAYLGLAPLVGGDLIQARLLNNLSSNAFAVIEQNKDIFAFEKAAELIDSGMDGKEALLKGYDCENEAEFKRKIKRCFLEGCDRAEKVLEENPDIKEILPIGKDPLALRKIYKKTCIEKAKLEAEAYKVQKNVIEKIDPNALNAQNKVNPIFYDTVIELLSE